MKAVFATRQRARQTKSVHYFGRWEGEGGSIQSPLRLATTRDIECARGLLGPMSRGRDWWESPFHHAATIPPVRGWRGSALRYLAT